MNHVFYKINLNKASNRLDQFEQQQKARRIFAIGFFFFIIIGVTAVSVFFSLKTQSRIDSYERELAGIEAEIQKLEESAQYLSPEDIFALAQLANNRMTWTEKLDVLGRILPSDVAVTEFYFDYQLRVLRIKGLSKVKAQMRDLDLVVSIVDLMKNNADFSKNFVDIRFASSTRLKYRGQDMVEFEIECLVG